MSGGLRLTRRLLTVAETAHFRFTIFKLRSFCAFWCDPGYVLESTVKLLKLYQGTECWDFVYTQGTVQTKF